MKTEGGKAGERTVNSELPSIGRQAKMGAAVLFTPAGGKPEDRRATDHGDIGEREARGANRLARRGADGAVVVAVVAGTDSRVILEGRLSPDGRH